MTVAIACPFRDGVLFCADTKITTGNERINQSKIHWKQWGGELKNGVTIFTVSGDTDYARAAIEQCEREISKRIDFQKTSLDEIQGVIGLVLATYYQMHIFPHPDRKEVGFDLLIGLWLDGETRTLATKETAVFTVDGYECVGSGGYLARYCLRQALGPESKYDPNSVTSEEASFVVEYAMNSAVEYDESCGYEKVGRYASGDAEYVGMMRDGRIGDIRTYQYLNEFPDALRTETWTLLRRLARSKDAAERETAIDGFVGTVRKQQALLTDLDIQFEKIRVAYQAVKASEESEDKKDEDVS